jgi:hypothetical protein
VYSAFLCQDVWETTRLWCPFVYFEQLRGSFDFLALSTWEVKASAMTCARLPLSYWLPWESNMTSSFTWTALFSSSPDYGEDRSCRERFLFSLSHTHLARNLGYYTLERDSFFWAIIWHVYHFASQNNPAKFALYSMLLYFPCGHFITTVVRLIQPKKTSFNQFMPKR